MFPSTSHTRHSIWISSIRMTPRHSREGRITGQNIRYLRSVVDLKKSRRSYPFPPGTIRPIILIVTVDGATVLPEFGGWACYDHNTHRWLTPDHMKALVASWFQQHCADY
jgi:hypothetical protein